MWTSQGLNLGPPDYESVALIDCDAKVAFIFLFCKLLKKKNATFYSTHALKISSNEI